MLRKKIRQPGGTQTKTGRARARVVWVCHDKVMAQHFPVSTAPTTEPANSAKAKLGAVLLIDDEKPLIELFAEALSPHFECVLATSTREAGFILHKRTFKVVVCDHLMPGGNGLSFLVDAREEYPDMQRVLVTGYMKPEMLLRSVNEAALYRYLLKPVSLPELVKTVMEAAKLHDQTVAARPA